ncbi:MAG: glycosyltransferase [Phycisphaerae bacterium]
MRIALLTSQFPGARLGGIGAYSLHAARALAAAGHEPHLFTFTLPEDVRRALPAGIVVHEVEDLAARAHNNTLQGDLLSAIQSGGEATYRLAMGALLCEAFRLAHAAKPFDIVEGPEYEALALPLMMGPPLDLPLVTQLHSGSALARTAMNLPQTSEQMLMEAFEFACIRLADARCAPSHQVIIDTRTVGPVEQAEVIPLPFVIQQSTPFSPPNPAGPILFLGRLEFIKGAHLLPEALNQFLAEHPAATVHLVGPDTATAPGGAGSMQHFIRARLSPAILPCVHFLGEQPRERVTAELAACSFVVVPSLFESYSYVCCEALAAGRPVVVSDSIGATEVVGDAGISFPRADANALAAAMHHLARDPALLQQLAERAHQRSRTTLSAETAINKRLAFYNRILHKRRSGQRRTTSDESKALPAQSASSLAETIVRIAATFSAPSTGAPITPGSRLLHLMNALAPNGGARIVLYGAGRHTARLLAEKQSWEKHGHQVVGIIDDHPRFHEQPSHLGLPVASIDVFTSKPVEPGVSVVLSTDTFTEQFWEKTAPLRAKGIPVHRLYP